jgi:hypothetical protein
MSPQQDKPVVKKKAPNNIYTAILAASVCIVLATAVFVAIQCYFQYGTIFTLQ